MTSRNEHGFVFVDVAPGSHTYFRPRRPDEPPPATFVLIEPTQGDESAAEIPSEPCGPVEVAKPCEDLSPLVWVSPIVAEDAELPPLDEEEDNTPLPPRDAIRAAVARQRRRPLAA